MSQVAALLSWMWVFASMCTPSRSLAESPVAIPRSPQWYGMPIWCTTCPSRSFSGRTRSLTSTRASTAARAVTTVANSPCSSFRSAASSGETSTKNSGCSSAR